MPRQSVLPGEKFTEETNYQEHQQSNGQKPKESTPNIRKRSLNQPFSLAGGSLARTEPKQHRYWDFNPLVVCPAAKISMSSQGSGNKSGHDVHQARQPSQNSQGENSGGARCCELLDLLNSRENRNPSQSPAQHNPQSPKLEKYPSSLLVDLFKSCRLQYEQTPLKITKASRQYMYDEGNLEYLDCVNSVAHVGHCHPAVVEALSGAMDSQVVTSSFWEIQQGDLNYPERLRQTLPCYFDTFLFCNSGSEAVDLSLQLARLYTCKTDAVVVDHAFHGSLDSVCALSPKVSKEGVDWVHVIPLPDLYKGTYQYNDALAIDKYISDSREILERARQNGRKIACFIAEPMLTIPGCMDPPNAWVQGMYQLVREFGGLCIADEVQTGLGRTGSHFWSFQSQNVVPDILVIGKPLGNGYPMAAVVTSRNIAAVLGDRLREYQCTSAMDAVGTAVLDILEKEQLMKSAAVVGEYLKDQFNILKKKHDFIGDIRGKGLVFGIEIVWSKHTKKAARDIAEEIVYRLKEENVIMANEGNGRNILMFIPPMCFSQENALALAQKLDKILTNLPSANVVKDLVTGLPMLSSRQATGTREVRLGIYQPQEDEDDDIFSSQQETMDLEYAQPCYHDLD